MDRNNAWWLQIRSEMGTKDCIYYCLESFIAEKANVRDEELTAPPTDAANLNEIFIVQ